MADYVTKEPYFDFETGDFVVINGRVKTVIGIERVKNKINKILHTQKGRYKIYDGKNYGIDVKNTVLGKTFTQDYRLSQIQREITDALLLDGDILSVEGFSAQTDGTHLTVEFTVTTVYGAAQISGDI